MTTQFGNGSWAVILGGSSGFGLATAHKLAEHGMHLCIVHRDRRAQLARIEPEFEKLRGHGGQLLTINADALDADKRGEILDQLAAAMGAEGRVRVLLHSVAFGNLKLLVAEKERAHARGDARGALARALGIPRERLVAAADELFAQGLDELHAVASPPQYPARAFLDAEDFARTIHSMGTSLLDWTQDLHARGLFAGDARVFGLTSEGNSSRGRATRRSPPRRSRSRRVARSIAVEFAPYGVRCNVIQAGVTETPALAAIPGSAVLKAQARLRNPFGRLTQPRDVANAIYLLSLDDAAWINGEVIRVDGGEHISGATS